MYNTDGKEILKGKSTKALKRDKLRHNEYYNMQSVFDNLYQQSLNGSTFKHLFNLIIQDENIMLAYRNIKRNDGSTTPGTNHHEITYWETQSTEYFLKYFKARLMDYKPMKVRRVEIPKPNGKMRPLGIPCIEDRIIQQCIKQVLEPICEAKFYPHSYGFRPNRSTEHAYSYLIRKINIDKCYHIVDVDIKGFFDNVDHGKLLKQIWSMGIQDKKLISIISAMLKAEIEGEGIPTKGVPQGGILSPLLANIVLNELDWWISSQWENFKTDYFFAYSKTKYRHLRKRSTLKEIYIVRYADDFKIICKSHQDAEKIFEGTKQWLNDRLKLEVSEEKSKVVDVRKQTSDFLGLEIKAKKKKSTYVITSHMSDKAKDKVKNAIKTQLDYIEKHRYSQAVNNLNSIIAGEQNYYSLATNVSKDFSDISYSLSHCLNNRIKLCGTKSGSKSDEYEQRYEHYGGREVYLCKIAVYPISYIKMRISRGFNQSISNYTISGRKIIHSNLKGNFEHMISRLASNPIPNISIEMNDNKLSLYIAQKGKCAISGLDLKNNFEIHKIDEQGNDRYSNLILVNSGIHRLLHSDDENLIQEMLQILQFEKKVIDKLNFYRVLLGK